MVSGKQAKVNASRQAKIAAAAPKQNRTPLIAGVLVGVIAVVGIVVAIVLGSRGGTTTASTIPAGATSSTGGIVVNAEKLKAGAPTLDIYEDFQCPACASAEELYGATLKTMSEAGQVKLVFHIKNFLEANFTGQGGDSSTRAAVAASCAADAGKFQAYHDAVFAGQPATEGAGFSDDQLNTFATTAGISGGALDTWKQCVKDRKYKDYINAVEDQSARDGYTSTPTYVLNGATIDRANLTAEDLKAQILAQTGKATATSTAKGTATAKATATATTK